MTGGVLFCGAWDEGPGYPRPAGLRQGLAAAGVAVAEVREPGLGVGKQRLLRQPWRWPGHWWQARRQRHRLLARLDQALAEQRPACVVVPYPGHLLVADIRRHCDVPVVLDLFLSAYDTVVEDRRVVVPGSLAAHWLHRLDVRACAAADLVLLDTPANAAYVATLTGLPPERFGWLPLTDPRAARAPAPWPGLRGGALELLFFGTGVPLHGLPVLLDAVAHAPSVRLVLVGGTQRDRALAHGALGDRVRLEPSFVGSERLEELLAAAPLVAGVFGDGGKAQRVVPWKVVHALAAGRPVVSADTPAMAGWLEGSGAWFPVPAGDATALAETLQELAGAPERLAMAAAAARPAYERTFGVGAVARRWQAILDRVLRSPGRTA